MNTRERPRLRMPSAAALLTLTLCLMAWPAYSQQELSPEEKLSAIRQGLVQAALEGPTKVQSTVWLDAQGALRESSSFRTGMEVRGVRVLSYERDSEGQPGADLRWQSMTRVDHAPQAQVDKSRPCKAAPPAGTLQHVVGMTIATAPGWSADELPAIRSLEKRMGEQWRGAAGEAVVWRMARSTVAGRSAYESALLGSSADQMPWQATLSLRPLSRSVTRLLPPPRNQTEDGPQTLVDTHALIALHLSLTARNHGEPLFEARAEIPWRSEQHGWDAPRLSEESQTGLAQQVQRWSQEIRQLLECEPVLPEVIVSNGEGVRINAGVLAGVHVGDEWLLASGKRFMQQIVEPGVAAQSVLARVQKVGQHYAQLQLVAGPLAAVQPNWRAWPAMALR